MKKEQEKKLTLKERLKDKREKAKLELMLYGIFFIAIIIFSRVMSSTSSGNIENNNNEENISFVTSIKDNYEYDIEVVIDDKTYEYYGKVLGNNSTVNLKEEDKVSNYYLMNNKYYIIEDSNYILVNEEAVYPYINNRYLNINNIKEYINIGLKENNTYKVKISDIILNSTSPNYITITTDENNKSLVIDYTELFKLTKEKINKVIVNISYSNIDKIITLGE